MCKRLVFIQVIFILFLAGCVTLQPKESIPTCKINGVTYYSLIPLCEAKGINWQYDTFTRVVVLRKGTDRINLKVGDDLILVNQRAVLLSRPIEIYEGAVVVPAKFKEQIIDVLFRKEPVLPQKISSFVISKKIRKIVVDAGHGGNDPGAIGRTGLREKDVNLDIAKRLALLLKSEGVNVVMTRSTDRFIPLGARVGITNKSGADIFVSIHSNANRTRSMNGFEVYYVASSLNDAKRALVTAKEGNLNLEGSLFASRSLELRAMLWDMIYAYDRAESIQLAKNICRSVGSNMNVKIIGVKDARYEVLRGSRIPAVLVEVGFVSNYNEERMLKNGFYRQKIAESIMDGISDYAQELAMVEADRR
ncbi:MAG: N-acetylmuramoyl-L-alanine amidase [Candidatus Omnitrophica bacterium]|nr:N-acetylmuramoyl-L-alanine amidase [Candidatus Omnitrophota bacterium]